MSPPWSLRYASWVWGAAGFIFALGPLLAALLLWLQYRSLRKNAFRLTDLIEQFAPANTVDLEPYIAEFERIENWLLTSAGWMPTLLLALYLLSAAATIAAYLTICKYTHLGARTAHVFGTILSIVSAFIVFTIWQAFAAISWLPIDALWANHLGLVIISLHLLGVVLVWLPASNRYVALLAAQRIALRVQANSPGARTGMTDAHPGVTR